jgi:hypothetical protein
VTLDDLAVRYGTDKASGQHGYTPLYERYLGHRRYAPLSLLELGVGGDEHPLEGGASLRMWRDWLPNASIVGIDIQNKSFRIDGVNIHIGSQADPVFIDRLANGYTPEGWAVPASRPYAPFDVIVDDASHRSSKTIASFRLLYPHLAPGGLYVVEDLHASYHAEYYGPEEANPNPDSAALTTQTAMQFLKRLADEVQYDSTGRYRWQAYPPDYWLGYDLEFVHFYRDICFIKKRETP